MTQQPADERSRDEVIREARTRLRTIQKLADDYRNPPPPDFGANSVAALLAQQWVNELVPAAEQLYERSRLLLAQLPYASYADLPAGPRGVLSVSQDLARDLGDNAQSLAQAPVAETGNQQLNDKLANFMAHVGGFMQDTDHRTRARNADLADQARAEQQGGDRS